jgi:hypothetical protein
LRARLDELLSRVESTQTSFYRGMARGPALKHL